MARLYTLLLLSILIPSRMVAQSASTQLITEAERAGLPEMDLMGHQPPNPAQVQAGNFVPQIERRYGWNATTMAWGDSAYWAYRYNAMGLMTRLGVYNCATADSLTREEHYYDVAGNDTAKITLVRIPGGWKNGSRLVKKYNDHNEIIDKRTYTDDGAGGWKLTGASKFDRTYDAQNRQTEFLYSLYGISTGVWVLSSRDIYRYNGNSALYRESESQSWTNNAWEPSSKYTDRTYDAQNRLLSYKYWDYNTNINDWRLTDVYTWTYQNATDHITLHETVSLNVRTNRLLSFVKVRGDSTIYLNQTWVNGAWQNSSMTYDIVNRQGDQTERITSSWTNNAWKITEGAKYQLAYDNDGNLVERIWDRYNTSSSQFIRRLRYLYSDFVPFTATKSIVAAEAVKAYPSPATSRISLPGAFGDGKAEVVDAAGRIYPVQLINGQADVSFLKPGLYQIRTVTPNSKTRTGRFLKE